VKWVMARNSLFAILLRSPWWISVAVALGIVLVAGTLLPERYAPYGATGAIPFLVIGAIGAWKQLRRPSAGQVAKTLEAVGRMSWGDFSNTMEDAFRRDGYAVTRVDKPQFDFELTKAGRTALVSCKRWKVTRTGIEPLRHLYAAQQSRGADECIYVAAGELTDNAREFAAQKKIQLLQGGELARLLRGGTLGKKA
jgi:restriction system protein